jgi:carotenoid cleavage dioxygenase
LAHIDLQTGKRVAYEFGAHDGVSEPVFAPRSADASEGDGHILCTVYRAEENRSDLAIFNALDIASGPIALAKAPRRVPFGFHGNWRPAA